MRKERKTIELKLLQLNEGQLGWLPRNPRQWTQTDIDNTKDSLTEDPDFLEERPVLVVPDDNGNYVVFAHNLCTHSAKALGWKKVPCVVHYPETDEDHETICRRAMKDNGSFGRFDWDELANDPVWERLAKPEYGIPVWQQEEQGDGEGGAAVKRPDTGVRGSLAERFVVPPFTILNSRSGEWRERKQAWRERIGDNGESRENTLAGGGLFSYKSASYRKGGAEYEKSVMADMNNGVSLLDPVLAEVICKWFGISGGKAFDCFAGDTVFGYVAASLGMEFTGIELRQEQADLNNERTQSLPAHYICDDGQNVAQHIEVQSHDLLFSCPPYFDLEVYSDLPNDASNQASYEDFLAILRNAFTAAVGCLKEDRFAVIVCGDIRDKEGRYRRFPDHIKDIFEEAGAHLYNELIYIEPLGSLPQRVVRYMGTRKIGKCHQQVLVFYKGDIKKIKDNYKAIEYGSEDLASFGVD